MSKQYKNKLFYYCFKCGLTKKSACFSHKQKSPKRPSKICKKCIAAYWNSKSCQPVLSRLKSGVDKSEHNNRIPLGLRLQGMSITLDSILREATKLGD